MKKELPVTLNVHSTTECIPFYMETVLLSNNKYLSWYIEKFNEYYVNERFEFVYNMGDLTTHLCYYDDVIEFKTLEYSNDIINTVINEINNDAYIMLFCDRYYVEGAPEYHNKHAPHGMILYGYDNENNVFNFADININGVYWGVHSISFENLKFAYESCAKMLKEYIHDWIWLYQLHLPASAIYLNKNFNRKPRLEVFFNQLERCLSGKETFYIEKKDGQEIHKLTRSGISIYKSYYEDLYNTICTQKDFLNDENNSFTVFKGLKSMVESKKALAFKLKYLNETGLILFPVSVIENAGKLCKTVDIAFLLIVKYKKNSDTGILEKAKSEFKKAEKLEIGVLTEIKNILYEYMEMRIIRNV